ncbi:MAG: hypothetical protein H7Y27_06660 [Gemmatimonadaceae bacterium]|nr:hypothetical protein [Chitinophagaceae bacterium]
MKKLFFILMVFVSLKVRAQELFVFTEPASNMPAKSLGIRDMNAFMFEKDGKLNYHNMPELMWGINKKWMVHAQGFISNRQEGGLKAEGGSLYAKYRFLSMDDIQSHFRMAVYGRYSLNNADIHQQEIETMGHNTGYESGIIATQLLHKIALSTSLSYERALDNKPDYKFPGSESNSAINYTFSVGKLMLPKVYRDYNQTNMNFMLEFLGQRLNDNGKSYLDIAPSVQFIINSQARVDIAYRQELYSTMQRTAPNGIVLKFEYTLFNVFK